MSTVCSVEKGVSEFGQSVSQPVEADIPEKGLVCRTAEEFIRRGDPAGAMETVCRGIERCGASGELEELRERIRDGRAKIAFFCGGDGDTFLKEIVSYAGQRYPVRVFEGSTSDQMHELMRWSDISWFEWCTSLAAAGTNLPKVCRNIIRLHRYEAYLSWPKQICWQNVDLLITVGNSFVPQALRRWIPDIDNRVASATIPNGVNLERIPFTRRAAGKNLAFVGTLRMVKNPMLLLACMAQLHSAAPEYKLFIAGKFQDLLLEQYFWHQVKALGLEDVVVFDGWQEDIAGWLADKHYIVSTSVIESQGMGILEAMAAGLKPVIHNFPGAEEIFSGRFLFNSPAEFCRQILLEDYDSVQYREFVERRYPLSRQLMQINEVFAYFEQQRQGGIFSVQPSTCSVQTGFTI